MSGSRIGLEAHGVAGGDARGDGGGVRGASGGGPGLTGGEAGGNDPRKGVESPVLLTDAWSSSPDVTKSDGGHRGGAVPVSTASVSLNPDLPVCSANLGRHRPAPPSCDLLLSRPAGVKDGA